VTSVKRLDLDLRSKQNRKLPEQTEFSIRTLQISDIRTDLSPGITNSFSDVSLMYSLKQMPCSFELSNFQSHRMVSD